MSNNNSNRIKAMAVQNEGDELTAAFWWCNGENEGWLRFSTTSTEVDAYSIDNLRQVVRPVYAPVADDSTTNKETP